mmetsp:Transcript_40958/g.109553  ORF Transcript_40958/g.109553 Transcript_40958/m.109553 type:complete len:108 (+) Transcript_40958:1151-1474(+)
MILFNVATITLCSLPSGILILLCDFGFTYIKFLFKLRVSVVVRCRTCFLLTLAAALRVPSRSGPSLPRDPVRVTVLARGAGSGAIDSEAGYFRRGGDGGVNYSVLCR